MIAGRGINVTFSTATPGDPNIGVLSAEDGKYENGHWIPARILNGDEILSGKGVRLRGDYYMSVKIKLYKYH